MGSASQAARKISFVHPVKPDAAPFAILWRASLTSSALIVGAVLMVGGMTSFSAGNFDCAQSRAPGSARLSTGEGVSDETARDSRPSLANEMQRRTWLLSGAIAGRGRSFDDDVGRGRVADVVAVWMGAPWAGTLFVVPHPVAVAAIVGALWHCMIRDGIAKNWRRLALATPSSGTRARERYSCEMLARRGHSARESVRDRGRGRAQNSSKLSKPLIVEVGGAVIGASGRGCSGAMVAGANIGKSAASPAPVPLVIVERARANVAPMSLRETLCSERCGAAASRDLALATSC